MEEAIEQTRLRAMRLLVEAPAQPQPTKPAPALRPAVNAKDSPSTELRTTHGIDNPLTSRPDEAGPALRPAAEAAVSAPSEVRAAHRTELPAAARPAEPKPLSTCDDNPVLNEQGAAFVLGVSPDLLKKWRQRAQGPDYIQYGPGGPVRYELKALLAFRDYHRIYLSNR
jgi:hypothetical protein